MQSIAKEPIPEDIALQLCERVRKENQGKWYSFLLYTGSRRNQREDSLKRNRRAKYS
jgi:hypothetical protein